MIKELRIMTNKTKLPVIGKRYKYKAMDRISVVESIQENNYVRFINTDKTLLSSFWDYFEELPEVGKSYKRKHDGLIIIICSISDSTIMFKDLSGRIYHKDLDFSGFEELPNQEPTTEESSTVQDSSKMEPTDKVKEALEELREDNGITQAQLHEMKDVLLGYTPRGKTSNKKISDFLEDLIKQMSESLSKAQKLVNALEAQQLAKSTEEAIKEGLQVCDICDKEAEGTFNEAGPDNYMGDHFVCDKCSGWDDEPSSEPSKQELPNKENLTCHFDSSDPSTYEEDEEGKIKFFGGSFSVNPPSSEPSKQEDLKEAKDALKRGWDKPMQTRMDSNVFDAIINLIGHNEKLEKRIEKLEGKS